MPNSRSFQRSLSSTTGSVMLWMIGMVTLAGLALNLAISISRVVNQQQELQILADRAVLAAGNHLDFEEFYKSGNLQDIALAPASVKSRVLEVIRNADATANLVRIVVSANQIQVELEKTLRLFSGVSSGLELQITADSRMRLQTLE